MDKDSLLTQILFSNIEEFYSFILFMILLSGFVKIVLLSDRYKEQFLKFIDDVF